MQIHNIILCGSLTLVFVGLRVAQSLTLKSSINVIELLFFFRHILYHMAVSVTIKRIELVCPA